MSNVENIPEGLTTDARIKVIRLSRKVLLLIPSGKHGKKAFESDFQGLKTHIPTHGIGVQPGDVAVTKAGTFYDYENSIRFDGQRYADSDQLVIGFEVQAKAETADTPDRLNYGRVVTVAWHRALHTPPEKIYLGNLLAGMDLAEMLKSSFGMLTRANTYVERGTIFIPKGLANQTWRKLKFNYRG